MPTDSARAPSTGAPIGWERIAGARRRVEALLGDLPPGFVVYRDVELPRPTQERVEHLVVGPRTIRTVTTLVVAEPVAWGRGRTSDTLFAGRNSLRPALEAAEWTAHALTEQLGHPVEPVLVIVAPEMPSATFDVHGVHVCEPHALMRQVAIPTLEYVDVASACRVVEERFGARPSAAGAVPSLGMPLVPPYLNPRSRRRVRRSLGARWHAIARRPFVRLVAVGALVAIVIATWSGLRSGVGAIVDEGSGIVDGAIGGDGGPAHPGAVGTIVYCPGDDAGWRLRFEWPGEPPDGVVGYGIRTRIGDEAGVVHPPVPWSDPDVAPAEIRLGAAPIVVVTEHHAADGTVLDSTTDTLRPPDRMC